MSVMAETGSLVHAGCFWCLSQRWSPGENNDNQCLARVGTGTHGLLCATNSSLLQPSAVRRTQQIYFRAFTGSSLGAYTDHWVDCLHLSSQHPPPSAMDWQQKCLWWLWCYWRWTQLWCWNCWHQICLCQALVLLTYYAGYWMMLTCLLGGYKGSPQGQKQSMKVSSEYRASSSHLVCSQQRTLSILKAYSRSGNSHREKHLLCPF